mmetsp:Transcript_76481/g.224454  ORF Transcript_76481/g.224454 Transcript_76481/m.224454 type:complete len:737 (-) Transcript_76481:103-2313(-)
MKFGKKLLEYADPSHLNHCIAYDVLTKAINVVVAAYDPQQENEPDIKEDMEAVDQAFGRSTQTLAKPGCQPPDSRFHTLLQHEMEKVNRFAALQLRTLLDTLNEAQRELARLDLDEPRSGTESHAAAAERLLDAAGMQLVALERFRRLNFTGFRKIAKKFDKKMREANAGRGSLASWFIPQLVRERFVATPLDPHLLALSWGYAGLRHRRRAKLESDPPAEASRAPGPSTTYWLTPSARMKALCMLVKRFDIALGPEASVVGDLGDAAAFVEQQRRLLLSMGSDGVARVPCQLSTDVSMLYYDAPGYPEYLARVRRSEAEGPAGFHYRRTLSESGPVGTPIDGLVERDGAASALDAHAFTTLEGLKSSDAFPMAAASADAEDSGSQALLEAAKAAAATQPSAGAAFAQEVATAASQAALAPVAAVGFSRVLLHGDSSGTRGVCVAIDEDVQFSRGPAGPAATAPSDAIDFPYCLLEVAGGSQEATSTWLAELRGHAILRKVAGFSIGAHAVAALHKEGLPELPHWYQQLSLTESSSPPEAWGLTLEWRAAVQETERGQEDAPRRPEPGPREAVGVKVAPAAEKPLGAFGGKPEPDSMEDKELRPKDFLASERTMLEWMHTAVALAFLGFGLWRYSLKKSTAASRADTLGLLDTSSSTKLALGIYSLLLLAIAVGFGWHAVLMHLKRLQALIKNNPSEPIFNARRGPVIFAVLLGLALAVNLVVQAVPLWRSLSASS